MLAMIEQLLYTQLFEIIKNTGRGYKPETERATTEKEANRGRKDRETAAREKETERESHRTRRRGNRHGRSKNQEERQRKKQQDTEGRDNTGNTERTEKHRAERKTESRQSKRIQGVHWTARPANSQVGRWLQEPCLDFRSNRAEGNSKGL